jgi:predicted dehydrogenase
MNKKIRIGIVGVGRMGITHYSIINSHPDVVVESVADSSSLILGIMKKYISVKTFKDYKEMLEISKPDAILVCTPPNLHYPIIKLAAEYNVHVFVEKPFTTSFQEAKELTRLYEEKGLVNQVGYVNRFNDVFVKAKELLDKQILGKIIRFRSEMFSCTITQPDDGSGWRGSRESGGGAVFEMASHAIDLVNFLTGRPDKVVGTSLNKIFSRNVEDIVSSTFLYENGITGTLYINWSDTSYRKPTNKIEFFGDGGRLLADQHSIKIFLNKPNEELNFRKGWNTLYITDMFRPVPFYVRGNEFTRQLYHFVECIQNRDLKNECTFNHGEQTLQVIDNMFKDYEQNSQF